MVRGVRFLLAICLALVLLFGGSATAQDDEKVVAVLTPYLASATTQIMVEQFEAYGSAKGWKVNVIDTAGDLAALDSRIQDVVTQNVDAIVISANPELVPAGIESANGAGIPIFGMDAGSTLGLELDVTSNNYQMAAATASYIVDRLEGVGRVVMFVHPPYAPVQKRGVIAQSIFDNTPDIEIVDQVFVAVPGPIENARNAMENILTANPEPGSISAVWAAWDEPAIGALQAIEAAGREGEGIVIVGIDAIGPAREAIAEGSNFEATIAQDFVGIAQTLADSIEQHLGGSALPQKTLYVPANLVNQSNAQ
jgi:ribose transport system substrate-binding protein